MVNIIVNKKINNNKFCNIIYKNNLYYIFSIDSIQVDVNINKFILFYEIYDSNFDFIKREKVNYEFKQSTLVWDILEIKNEYLFLIEQKSINKISHQCKFYKYYIKKENLENFIIEKIEKIELEDHLISTIFKNKILASKIKTDEERPDYFWGKYLFYFQDENKHFYKPVFDTIVNYDKDKGHILHFIEEINKNIDKHKWDFDNDGNPVYNTYFVIFSIRHKYEDEPTKYYYKIYSAYSDDLKYFYNTKEVQIEDNISESKWYCYPEVFKKDNKYYVLMCQDDFGKEKETLLGELII